MVRILPLCLREESTVKDLWKKASYVHMKTCTQAIDRNENVMFAVSGHLPTAVSDLGNSGRLFYAVQAQGTNIGA